MNENVGWALAHAVHFGFARPCRDFLLAFSDNPGQNIPNKRD